MATHCEPGFWPPPPIHIQYNIKNNTICANAAIWQNLDYADFISSP